MVILLATFLFLEVLHHLLLADFSWSLKCFVLLIGFLLGTHVLWKHSENSIDQPKDLLASKNNCL